jgi:inorganic pyrophosphatase
MKDVFWATLDQILAESKLVIDRPKGSTHPRYPDLLYQLDYGYLEGTDGGDGEEMDVWVGSLPEKRLTGILCTYDTGKHNAELKLLVGCTPQEIDLVRHFNAEWMRYLFIPYPTEEI